MGKSKNLIKIMLSINKMSEKQPSDIPDYRHLPKIDCSFDLMYIAKYIYEAI